MEAGPGLGLARRLLLQAALIHGSEVDGIEHEGREAAIAGGLGQDLPRKREEQARALDQDRRMQHLLGKVLQPEGARIDQLGSKDHFVLRCCLCIQVKFHLEIGGCKVPGVYIDRDIDVGLVLLGCKRLGSIRALEAQVLEVLSKNAD